MSVRLWVDAYDPDGDHLTYQYLLTGGRIVGAEPEVVWELDGLMIGHYEAKVIVGDQRGGIASESLSVKVDVPCCLPCAVVRVDCPTNIEDGEVVTFQAQIAGGHPSFKPVYRWSISAGTIIKGYETPVIEVATTGLNAQEVTATLEVSNFPPECQNMASCTVRLEKRKAQARTVRAGIDPREMRPRSQ